MDKLIYSVCLGNYDTVKPLPKIDGFRAVMFTDTPDLNCPGWEKVIVEPKKDLIRQTREIKINIHQFIQADLYVYMDANYEVHGDLKYMIGKYYRGGWMAFSHSKRNCIYQEAKAVIAQGRDTKIVVERQMAEYFKDKYPAGYGLLENGFFIRDRSFDGLCEDWYREVEKHSWRDQLSLMYVMRKHKRTPVQLQFILKKKYLTLIPRAKVYKEPIDFKVWYFNPGRGDKNLGRAYNEHCALVPNDDDWICMTDGDVMQINEFWPAQIEDIIRRNQGYALISCMTNRLGLKHQLPNGLSNDPDVLNHYKISKEHFDKYYDQVVPSIRPTAGLLMLFPKRTWNRVKFEEGLTKAKGMFVDARFAMDVLQKKGKIGIAKGLYVFHYYRFHHESIRDFSHLK